MEHKTFEPRAIPRSAYDKKIDQLTDEYTSLMKAAEEVNQEIRWLVHGRDHFAPDADGDPAQTVLKQVADLAPRESREKEPEPPNIRAKIDFVIRQQGNRPMQPIRVIEALQERGWMPSADSAPQMIRNRMLNMLAKDQLGRDGDGYWLTAYPKGEP